MIRLMGGTIEMTLADFVNVVRGKPLEPQVDIETILVPQDTIILPNIDEVIDNLDFFGGHDPDEIKFTSFSASSATTYNGTEHITVPSSERILKVSWEFIT